MDGRRITAVHTTQGTIHCEKVVNCGGMWAREIGAMAGINVPLQPVKHQYIITEKIDGLSPDAPTLRDPDRRTYFKEEVGGLVMGGYEPNPQGWVTGDIPKNWEFRLFDDDYDHFGQHLEQAIARIPALEKTGVKQMINGAESFTPDGNFILGPAPECANMFVGAGFNAFGIASGGGAGWVLAEWVMRDEAPLDLWVVDIRRFSDLHRDRDWVFDRTMEAYGKHYTIGFPHEEYTSGRPRITSPLYDRLKTHRAVFGSKLGWERPNWFAPQGMEPQDIYSMGRQNWFVPVGAGTCPCPRKGGDLRSVLLCQIRTRRSKGGRGAGMDLRQPRRPRCRPPDLYPASEHPRRDRGRPDRRPPVGRPVLHRHRHRFPHP